MPKIRKNKLVRMRDNQVDLIAVDSKLVFTHEPSVGAFCAKIIVDNLAPRNVSFVVRSTAPEHFRIRPRYGYIPPQKSLDIVVTTRTTKLFTEISQDWFGIFVVPIYDKRQLEKRKLNLLWRAHGTPLFPFAATEFHKISYVLPKFDDYLDNESILSRLFHMSATTRSKQYLVNDEAAVDEETFFLNWPAESSITKDEHGQGDAAVMMPILQDWHKLCRTVQIQSTVIMDDAKVSIMMVLILLLFIGSVTFANCSSSSTSSWPLFNVVVNGRRT